MASNCSVNGIDVLGLCCCGDCEVKNFVAVGPLLLGFRLISDAGQDFFSADILKMLSSVGEEMVDRIVDHYGSQMVKAIREKVGKRLKQVELCAKVGSFFASTGWTIRVQLSIGYVYSYQRRDCVREHLFSSGCAWGQWRNVYGDEINWMSPPDVGTLHAYGDAVQADQYRFFGGEVVTNLDRVFKVMKDSIVKIVQRELQSASSFGPSDVKDIMKCKVVP